VGHRHKSTHPMSVGVGIDKEAVREYGGISRPIFHFGRSGQIKPPPARVEPIFICSGPLSEDKSNYLNQSLESLSR